MVRLNFYLFVCFGEGDVFVLFQLLGIDEYYMGGGSGRVLFHGICALGDRET